MRVEHLIYGTFPDTPGSQHVIYKSDGVTPELQNFLINFYDQFGDCKGEEFKRSVSVCRSCQSPDEELTVVTQVSHHGRDFSGRWGALLRHSAILTLEQYQLLSYRPDDIEKHLVSSGTAEELAHFGDLEIETTTASPDVALAIPMGEGAEGDGLAGYQNSLTALLHGQRLVLYAENNTDYSNRHLRTLVSLLPTSCRKLLNWSEFAFRPSDDLDLALVYSSRYEAPTAGRLAFAAVGENHLNALALTDEFINDYLTQLTAALSQRDWPRLQSLLTSA